MGESPSRETAMERAERMAFLMYPPVSSYRTAKSSYYTQYDTFRGRGSGRGKGRVGVGVGVGVGVRVGVRVGVGVGVGVRVGVRVG